MVWRRDVLTFDGSRFCCDGLLASGCQPKSQSWTLTGMLRFRGARLDCAGIRTSFCISAGCGLARSGLENSGAVKYHVAVSRINDAVKCVSALQKRPVERHLNDTKTRYRRAYFPCGKDSSLREFRERDIPSSARGTRSLTIILSSRVHW